MFDPLHQVKPFGLSLQKSVDLEKQFQSGAAAVEIFQHSFLFFHFKEVNLGQFTRQQHHWPSHCKANLEKPIKKGKLTRPSKTAFTSASNPFCQHKAMYFLPAKYFYRDNLLDEISGTNSK